MDWSAVLGTAAQPAPTVSTLPVQLAVAGANPAAPVGARRTPARGPGEQSSRRVCRHRAEERAPAQAADPAVGGLGPGGDQLPPTLLPDATALALYRVRWQIEIAIKRWKSVLDVDLLRARYESPLADVWCMASYSMSSCSTTACAAPWASSGAGWIGPVPPPGGAPGSCCKPRWPRALPGASAAQHPHWAICLQVLAERPRRRQLQRLPQEVILVFASV